MTKRYLFTSESVTEGHPDKMADQISDGLMDAIISKDPTARVAIETFLTTGSVIVGGEVTTDCYIDIQKEVRKIIKDIGYTKAEYGFDYETCSVMNAINEQSPDIAQGVDDGLETRDNHFKSLENIGAGDQGIMFGYATDESDELMPMPIFIAHKLAKRLAEVRKSNLLGYLRPDGKTQVTIIYEDGEPVGVDTVVVSAQHDPEVSQEQIREDIIECVIKPVLWNWYNEGIKIYVNPTGRFVTGGPKGDTGLTGRKIIVDTYGGMGRHGGGCFSGKDPTKVDRSAAYAARWVAKNVVAAGFANKCEIQLSYAIGVSNPISIHIDTFGTGKCSEDKLIKAINKVFDLRPGAIISNLDLRKPIYKQVAAYGHFGRDDVRLPWEDLNKVDELVNVMLKMED